MPNRIPEQSVLLIRCQPKYACLDKDNFKALLHNRNNTEAYIIQLQNLIQGLAEPVLP